MTIAKKVATTVIAVCLAAGSVSAFITSDPPRFHVVPIVKGAWVLGMNNRCQVVGSVGDSAFVYRNGRAERLPWIDSAVATFAEDINDSGLIVGYALMLKGSSYRYPMRRHACLWRDGRTIDIAPRGMESLATSVNDSGMIVGSYGASGGNGEYLEQVFCRRGDSLWSLQLIEPFPSSASPYNMSRVIRYGPHNGPMVDPRLYGSPWTFLDDAIVNNEGDVTASFSSSAGKSYSVIWTKDSVVDLISMNTVWDMNDRREVVGVRHLGERGFMSGPLGFRVEKDDPDGTWFNLDEYDLDASGFKGAGPLPVVINNRGDIASTSSDPVSGTYGALWLDSLKHRLPGVFIENSAGEKYASVDAINDSGFFAGSALFPSRGYAGYLCVPMPPKLMAPAPSRVRVSRVGNLGLAVTALFIKSPLDVPIFVPSSSTDIGLVDTLLSTGTECVFGITIASPGGEYVHLSNSCYARVTRQSPTRARICFESEPDTTADWSYTDAVIDVEFVDGATQARPRSGSAPGVAGVLARRVNGSIKIYAPPNATRLRVFDVMGRETPGLVSQRGHNLGRIQAAPLLYIVEVSTREGLVRKTITTP